jgi:peptide/nickel transport system permease protein
MTTPDVLTASRGLTVSVFRASRLWRDLFVGLSGLVLLVLVMGAAVGPLLVKQDPNSGVAMERLQGPSARHWAGTDEFGRDVLSRLIAGARVSLFVGVVAVSVAGIAGLLVGVACGFYGGVADLIVQRIVDALMALPTLLFLLVVVTVFGSDVSTMAIAIGLAQAPTVIRVIRSVALSLKQELFIDAARVSGASDLRILALHVAPGCIPALLVLAAGSIGVAIIAEGALSFLGVGVQPPQASWGNMLAGARPFVSRAPWLTIAPSICVVLTVMAFNVLADHLRDLLDPKLRRALGRGG